MGVTVCKHECGSVSVKRYDLLTLESFTPWSPFNLQVLDLLLKGPQLVSKAVIHAKTVSKQSILTQTDELQRVVEVWGADNTQTTHKPVVCSNVGTMTLDMVAKTTTTRMMKATCANLKDLWRIMKR